VNLPQLAADSGELVVARPAMTLNIRLSCVLVRMLHRVLKYSIFNPQKSATHLTGYWHLCEPRTGTHDILPRVSSCHSSAWQMPSEAFHSAPNATALPALAPIRGRMKNDRALCPPQKYICSLLEGTILGNGTKRAAKRRHSNIQFFLLKGGMAQWASFPPNAAPGPYGPILASSGEIGAIP